MRRHVGIGGWQRGLQPMLLLSTSGQRHSTPRKPCRCGGGDPRTNRRSCAGRPAAVGGGRRHRSGNRSACRLPDLGMTSRPTPEGQGRRSVPRTRRHMRDFQITTPHQPPIPRRRNMVHEPGGGAPRALHLASLPSLRHHPGPNPNSPQGNEGARAPRPHTRHRRGGLSPPCQAALNKAVAPQPPGHTQPHGPPEGRAFRPHQ